MSELDVAKMAGQFLVYSVVKVYFWGWHCKKWMSINILRKSFFNDFRRFEKNYHYSEKVFST